MAIRPKANDSKDRYRATHTKVRLQTAQMLLPVSGFKGGSEVAFELVLKGG